jgi:HAD superfamily hydrolase (TIGR01509 family)
MIKGIFFDAADVFYYRPSSTTRYALDLLAQRGYSTEISEHKKNRQTHLHVQATEGRITHEEFWDKVLQMHGVDVLDVRQILTKQILDYANRVLAIPGGRDALAGLQQRGFVLGIVTDTMYPLEWKMNWLTQVGVAQYIDVVACSTVLGAHKPHPAIYLNALQQAHLAPSESAFVGHDAGELEGAHQAGIATVAVNHDTSTKADYYAKSLIDLLNVPIFQASARFNSP